MMGKVRQLKGRSFDELSTRGRQLLQKTAERIGIASLSDEVPSGLRLSATARHNLSSFPQNPEKFIELVESGWPDEISRILKNCEKILIGKFDLLGYADLDFGGTIPSWHHDPISGKDSPMVHWTAIDEINPEVTGDKKVIWELNRHQYLVTLGQGYFLTQDERYAKCFLGHLISWMESNPPKFGVNWLSSLELAFRSISWIRAYFLFENSELIPRELKSRIFSLLFLNARHIEKYLSTYFAPNTHLTGEALGLYYVGTFLDAGRYSERWREIGYAILKKQASIHIRSDGSYCEQASHYARYTADFYADLTFIRRREGLPVDEHISSQHRKLYEFLMHISGSNGLTPLFGDDDGGKYFSYDGSPIDDMRSAVALGAILFKDPQLKYTAGDAGPELLWVAGIDGLAAFDRIESQPPPATARAFPDGGYFAARSSWKSDADHLLISCGQHGFLNGGHAHADALSFVAHFNGQPVFVDSGTYVYTTDLEARNRFRSGSSHNCVTVNGTSAAEPDGPFSWRTMIDGKLLEWSNRGDQIIFEGEHAGFEDLGVSYSRWIEWEDPHEIKLTDVFKSTVENTFEINFILDAECAPEIDERRVRISRNIGVDKLVVALRMTSPIISGTWELKPHQISPIYGKLVGSKRLAYTCRRSGEFAIPISIQWEVACRSQ